MFSILGSTTKSTARRPVPPIDLNVPETLETATFANG